MFERLQPCLRAVAPTSRTFSQLGQLRGLRTKRALPIPEPRPFVPDIETFFKLIGRGMSKYAVKFPTWESFFSMSSNELKTLGIEPVRNRRYLTHWKNKYRRGEFGPGGDFEFVKDGEAILKVAMPLAGVVSQTKYVVNVPHPDDTEAETPTHYTRPKGYTVRGEKDIAGPQVKPMKVSGASVKAVEGMWELLRGRKIDGGERRRGEVQFKKRSAERRAQREAEILGRM